MVNNLKKILLSFLVVFFILQPFGVLVAQAQSTPSTPSSSSPKSGSEDFGCGVSAFTNCIAAMVYYAGPGLAVYFASIGAYYFSIIVSLSLDSTAYALGFISSGWEMVRGIANMAFIFLLIYIALIIMFEAETARTMQMLVAVIAIALVVNFSFYITRVVIDAGNILAVQFYNALPNQGMVSGTQIKDISLSVMSAINVQELYGPNMLKATTAATGNNSTAGLITTSVVYISVAFMFWTLFFSFITAGIKFMIRIVALWLVLISSPLAFVAWTVEGGKEYFERWYKTLFEFSIYPAVYLFMFLILNRFITSILIGSGGAGGGTFNAIFAPAASGATGTTITATIANVAIRMGFVTAMLFLGVKVADKVAKQGTAYSRKVAEFGFSGATKAGSSTLGFFGRNTFGVIGAGIGQSSAVKAGATQAGLRGSLWRGVAGGANRLSSATYDPRNVPGGGLLKKGAETLGGIKIDAGKAGGSIADKIADRMKKNEQQLASRKATPSQIQDKYKGIIAALEPDKKAELKAAAENYAKIASIAVEDRTEEDKKALKSAKAEFTRQARSVIDTAKSQANAGADEFINKKAKNVGWSLGQLADTQFVNKQRAKEKTDAEKIKDILAGIAPSTTATLTRKDVSASTEKLMGGIEKVVESIEKNTSYAKSQADTARNSLKELGKNGEKTGEVLKKINENISSKNNEA